MKIDKGHYQPKRLYFSNRLTKTMGDIFDHPLTVVEAPMGYGKTTAVREHLNIAGVKVIWQSIYDGATASFWSGFCKLFAEIDSLCSKSLDELGLPDDSVSRQAALELIEGVILPKQTIWVMDDYHLIQNADVHDFIVFLVKNEIANLNIVIITRLATLESLDELRLKGYAHHITKEALELTSEEITMYYKLCGISLKADQANILYAYTEGWISALYLLMLKFIKEGRFEQETPGLPDALIPNIYNLVEKAIYAPLSQEQQGFLLQVSIFDSFTEEQAAYIWQKANTSQILAEIFARNAFLTYDPKSKAYHLHNILTTYLQDKLAGTDPLYRQDLYQKAGQWYLEAGNYLEAMQCFYRCGDFGRLLESLETDKANSIDGEHQEMLIQYFDACPREALTAHPAALSIMGKCLFLFNQKERVAKICREFEKCIETAGNLDQLQRNKLLGEYERLLTSTSYNNIGEMFRHLKSACELLLGIASTADLTESWALFGSPSGLYMFYRESGKLEQTVNDGFEAISFYIGITKDTRNAAGYIMAAERHFLMGEVEDAEILLHQIFHTGNPEYLPGFMVRGLFLQVRLALVKGDFVTVLSLLQRLRKDIHENRWYLFMHTLDLCEAYIYAHLGQKTEIPPWIAAGEFKKTRLFFPVMGFVNIVYGRVLLMNGEYLKLIGNTDQFLRTASFFPNILGQIYTYIQLAAAYKQIYRKDEALAALKRALEIAMPDRVLMPFVENGDFIQPLLEEVYYKEGLYREDIPKILETFRAYRKATEQIYQEYFSGGKPQLTDQEQTIAELAASGLTNGEIGIHLFISPNTVKARLKSIFEKLGINSRALLKQYLD
jgi:LuxR family transcriptional regulator, maltose regulon positive regulatory protein